MSESIGSATKHVQGYPTQIWLPRFMRANDPNFALVHDRRGCDVQPGVFFMPGNALGKLAMNLQTFEVLDDNGQERRLRIPAALLWDFHGGPCTGRGERYREIGAEVMDEIYARIARGGVPSILRDEKVSYVGPLDRSLAAGDASPAKARFTPIERSLIRSRPPTPR